jgi:small ligand-binding sensory domain FIST
MKLFPCGHATHPDAHMAAALVLAQLRAQMARPEYASAPTLGLLYITDRCAAQAAALLTLLRTELPQVHDWVGATGIGVCASGAEYWDEPALAVMLCDLAPSQYRVFSGLSPLPPDWGAHSALVHADPHTPELSELLADLATRTRSQQLFGGLVASRQEAVQFAVHAGQTGDTQGAFTGGLSGVAWAADVPLLGRLTQGCQPVGPAHRLGRVDDLVALELDGEPALDVLQRDLDISLAAPQRAVQVVRQTLVGLSRPGQGVVGLAGELQTDVRVRHIIGLDPMRQGVALAEPLQTGMELVFCRRDPPSARADLMRICAELREALEPDSLSLDVAMQSAQAAALGQPQAGRRIAGAVYVSCTGRGGGHFGGPSAEMQIIRHALGEVPLVGFYAAGEIAGQQLYGYTGVLTVFTTD